MAEDSPGFITENTTVSVNSDKYKNYSVSWETNNIKSNFFNKIFND
jgi:hypothetical protein